METLELNCWIRGQDVKATFSVSISSTATVGTLKHVIRNASSHRLDYADTQDLVLYKVSIPCPRHVEETPEGLTLDPQPAPIHSWISLSTIFSDLPLRDHLHIVVEVPSSLAFVCWIRGQDLGSIFIVKILSMKTVSDLKKVIKDTNLVAFRNTDANTLGSLHNVSLPYDEHLGRSLEGLTLHSRLDPLAPLCHIFPNLPPRNQLHIVITETLHREKHAREEADVDVVEVAKCAKITHEAPSTLAQPRVFKAWHADPNKSSGDEPHLMDDTPISLQYEGFGRFLDIFRGRQGVPGMENVSSSGIVLAVDRFADQMSVIYPTEAFRSSKGRRALNDIFSARTDNRSFRMSPATIDGKVISDGHILGRHDVTCCIVEFKNEMATTAIPYVEMIGYFAHSTREAVSDSARLVKCWNFPCLGLTIIGHHITFYGMIFYGEWRIVCLTPSLSCIRASGEGDDRIALYAAFRAASVLLGCIDEDAVKFVSSPPPQIEGSRDLPNISSLHHPRTGTSIKFKILEKYPFRATDRHLYIAEMTNGKEILVKFTRRYSLELHTFCADHGHAPSLLGFERLPGGFYGVAMEFVKRVFPISRSPYVNKHSEWMGQLEQLVGDFHVQGLVHGDLCDSNIICDENRAMLVDFDWGGKLGEVSYPDGPLNPDLTDGRVAADLKITKDDDLRILHRTLQNVRLESA